MKDKTIVFYIFIRYRTISLVPLYIGPAQAAIHLDVTISNNHVNTAKWCTIINEKTWLCWYKRLFCTNSAEKNPSINNNGQGFVIRCTPPVQPSHGNKCLYKFSLVLWIQTTATRFFHPDKSFALNMSSSYFSAVTIRPAKYLPLRAAQAFSTSTKHKNSMRSIHFSKCCRITLSRTT